MTEASALPPIGERPPAAAAPAEIGAAIDSAAARIDEGASLPALAAERGAAGPDEAAPRPLSDLPLPEELAAQPAMAGGTSEGAAAEAPAAAAPQNFPAVSFGKRQSEKVLGYDLLAFLKSRGGLQDQNGELSALGLHKAYPGIVNNKRGMTLDYARELAAQNGYLGAHTDRATAETTIDDLLEALKRRRVYSADMADEIARGDEAARYNHELDRLEDHARSIQSELDDRGQPPLDDEWLRRAAEIMHSGEAGGVDEAVERAAIELYERDAEQARLYRETPQIPELTHEDLEAIAQEQADHYGGEPDDWLDRLGPGEGDGPGAEGDARAAPGEVPAGREAAAEAGPEGTRQTLIEGVAPVADRETIAARQRKPMRGGNADLAHDSLFGDAHLQRDMFAAQRADAERLLRQAPDLQISLADETGEPRQIPARQALAEADEDAAAARELAACIMGDAGEPAQEAAE